MHNEECLITVFHKVLIKEQPKIKILISSKNYCMSDVIPWVFILLFNNPTEVTLNFCEISQFIEKCLLEFFHTSHDHMIP